ncbi:MAG TPA: hypothetical protein VM324_03735 [Egibacteraceae bacterium]|nr:hypothetical protein [Egibacteraceae bacterium]
MPADKVTVVAYPAAGGHVRRFVCPHCRGLTGGRVGSVEAARLVAAGAVMTCAGPPASPLTEDELIAFGRSTAGASDLARLAVDG